MFCRRVVSAGLALLLAGASLSVPLSAMGQVAPTGDSPARVEAIRKYQEGSKAFEEKRYKDAIDLFLEADSFVSSAALAYNTSVAYEAMGDASSALRWAREYLRRAPTADDRAHVQKTIDRLEIRLKEKGVQQVTIASTPLGATVLVDDRPMGVTPWTGDLRPGNHRVELRLLGYQRTQQVFDLRPDRSLDVAITLTTEEKVEASPKATPPGGVLPVVKPTDNKSADALTVVGVVTLAAGALGLGAAIGLEVARAGAEADAREAELQVDAADKLATMEDLQLGARVAIGVGGGLALAGGTLLVVGLVSREPETAPLVTGGCSNLGCMFGLRGRF